MRNRIQQRSTELHISFKLFKSNNHKKSMKSMRIHKSTLANIVFAFSKPSFRNKECQRAMITKNQVLFQRKTISSKKEWLAWWRKKPWINFLRKLWETRLAFWNSYETRSAFTLPPITCHWKNHGMSFTLSNTILHCWGWSTKRTQSHFQLAST